MVDKEKAGEAIHSFLEALGLDLTELDMEKTPQPLKLQDCIESC